MTTAPPQTIDEYVAGFPKEVQAILQKIRSIIQKAAPEAEETIKYQIPTFVWHGNLVHFAAFAKHVGFYPTPSGISHFQDELAAYHSAKGSVQFPLESAIPYSLIKKIVEFRVQETRDKLAAKASKKKTPRAAAQPPAEAQPKTPQKKPPEKKKTTTRRSPTK